MLAICRRSYTATVAALFCQRRGMEYWGYSVTGRTQPYAQGDMLPRVDNTRHPVNKACSVAASLTGSQVGIAYDSNNIFDVEAYSRLEKDHYRPIRGISRYKVEPVGEGEGQTTLRAVEELESEVAVGLDVLWWGAVLKDFPSLAKICSEEFKAEFVAFYKAAFLVAHNEAAVTELASPFVRRQMQENYISFPMFWRIAEKLADGLEKRASSEVQGRSMFRVVVERVTKIALNTIADEAWANDDATSPLLFDVSNFRAWHEAGNW
ncbi:hypothetical protein ERJ75_000133100 [Trypanosoma vivax]|uniref:NADH-ubiquinone oxidoreductase complex I subunit n=1 Tax=Trypanosoma vivax (strain Y486) TaxID=1055687 RepID=G0TT39_TRYVY|nr:hypothetical protein TRVL_02801 [Trypanosoma vivax]KAH8619780.1 hypothetical protein ERJ75_000133100 [Trypanosoma vivax]CCC47120.1 conserved hypothetical protein [Trypanosoma vivax Y486]